MGIVIEKSEAYFEFNGTEAREVPRQVLSLATKTVSAILARERPANLSHLIVATSCPDMLSPSLGQMLIEKFHAYFGTTHAIDIVQGCAGGVTAMILGSQLAELNQSSVMVVLADAAKKATSKTQPLHKIFGNGSFACIIRPGSPPNALLYYKSRQYKALSEVVTINMGHDADEIILRENGVTADPRKYLGLSMNKGLALQLLKNAESFYNDFVKESTVPDAMILHQVNPAIMKYLRSVFAKYKTEFIDHTALTGNCGAASIGIAYHRVKESLEGKKILICGFGTGGVITAGLWQT